MPPPWVNSAGTTLPPSRFAVREISPRRSEEATISTIWAQAEVARDQWLSGHRSNDQTSRTPFAGPRWSSNASAGADGRGATIVKKERASWIWKSYSATDHSTRSRTTLARLYRKTVEAIRCRSDASIVALQSILSYG